MLKEGNYHHRLVTILMPQSYQSAPGCLSRIKLSVRLWSIGDRRRTVLIPVHVLPHRTTLSKSSSVPNRLCPCLSSQAKSDSLLIDHEYRLSEIRLGNSDKVVRAENAME